MPDLAQWALLAAIGLVVAGARRMAAPREARRVGHLRHAAGGRGARAAPPRGARCAARRRGRSSRRLARRRLLRAGARRGRGARGRNPRARPLADDSAPPAGAPRRGLVGVPGALVALALAGRLCAPGSIGLGQRTVVNQALADAIRAGGGSAGRDPAPARPVRGKPAGSRRSSPTWPMPTWRAAAAEDLQRGGGRPADPARARAGEPSAYRRLINAYIVTGYYDDAQATTDAYATIARPGRAGHPLLPRADRVPTG